jgi:hypothetical protein
MSSLNIKGLYPRFPIRIVYEMEEPQDLIPNDAIRRLTGNDSMRVVNGKLVSTKPVE